MERIVLVEAHYLPCVAWFSQISRFQQVKIDLLDKYRKQTYRNRCRIRGANKVENLIVPIIGRNKELTKNVYIDYNQKWVNNHCRAISSAYGKAPFFEYFGEDILKVYQERHEKLFDLNLVIIRKCMEFLGIKTELVMDAEIEYHEKDAVDLRNLIHPKKKDSLDQYYNPTPYFQVFGDTFVGNLSVIDLLFCEGPASGDILKKSSVRVDNFDK